MIGAAEKHKVTAGVIFKLVGCRHEVTAAAGAVIDIRIHGEGLFCHNRVRIGADRDRVFAGFQDVSAAGYLDAGVIGGKIFLRDGEGNRLGCAGLKNAGLGKVNKVDCCLLNAAVGVRRGEVDFNHILACNGAGVLYIDIKGYGVAVSFEVGDLLFKGGVAQAVTEGVLHNTVIVKGKSWSSFFSGSGFRLFAFLSLSSFSCGSGCLLCGFFRISRCGKCFCISGFIITVADINAFHIVYESHVAFIGTVSRSNCLSEIVHIVVGKVAEVVPGRGSGQVIDIGVDRVTGGVDRTGDHLAESGEAGVAGARSQNHSTDLRVVIHPAEFHGVVGIDDNNNLVKLRADFFHHVLFGDGELQVVLTRLKVIIAAVVGINASEITVITGDGHFIGDIPCAFDHSVHIGRQVSTLTAGTADDDHSHIGKSLCLIHHTVGVGLNRGLGERPVLALHGNRRPVGTVVGVELGQFLVGGIAGILQ